MNHDEGQYHLLHIPDEQLLNRKYKKKKNQLATASPQSSRKSLNIDISSVSSSCWSKKQMFLKCWPHSSEYYTFQIREYEIYLLTKVNPDAAGIRNHAYQLGVSTHPDYLTRYIIMQNCFGYCKLHHLWGYYEGTLMWQLPLCMQ